MTDYTVVPAHPGTKLLFAIIGKDEQSDPRIEEAVVIAWRIPNAPGDWEDPKDAVLLGSDDKPVVSGVQETDSGFVIQAILLPDGSLVSGEYYGKRDEFLTGAFEMLCEQQEQFLAQNKVA
jgi:hypothetical protein